MENNEKYNISENIKEQNKTQTQALNNLSNSQNQNNSNQQQQKNMPFIKPNERVKTKVINIIYNSQFLSIYEV